MVLLPEFISNVLKERRLSQRALALHVGVSNGTISRLLRGKPADHETLRKLSEYLSTPLEDLYRMAGMLPPEPERNERQELIELILYLLGRLPEKDQAEIVTLIVDIVRSKVERHERQREQTEPQPR